MDAKFFALTVFVTGLIISGGSSVAFGAQMDAFVNPDKKSSPFEIKYQKTVFIEYQEGGQVADLLRGQTNTIQKTADLNDPGIKALRDALNKKLEADGSFTQINDLTVEYTATLTGRTLQTAIDLRIVMDGTLEGYIIRERQGQNPALVDVGWRGMSVSQPVILDGTDINTPISAVQQMAPEVHSLLAGTGAEALLSEHLINADGIKNQPLSNWHFLFDPTGINVDASTFGLSEEIQGFVVSGFTMGESSIREGRQVEKIQSAEFTTDRNYVIRTVQSADVGNLNIVGFAAIDKLDNLEIVGVTPRPPEGYATTSTGEFPIMIVYGMAGLAAVGGIGFFIFSNRALKKEKFQGQTGIDPSRLRAYATSAGSGGYQTVRGEAQLIDDTGYAKTRSVYEESDSQQRQQSPPPAISTTQEPACGCAASAEMGSECDCEMQGSCLCDATCNCHAQICKDQVASMS